MLRTPSPRRSGSRSGKEGESPRRDWTGPSDRAASEGEAPPRPPRSHETLLRLVSCRHGYTSPRIRQAAAVRSQAMLSIHDAAYEGDVDGLKALLDKAKATEDAEAADLVNQPGYLRSYSEGLAFEEETVAKGFVLKAYVSKGGKKPPKPNTLHAATPLAFAIAASRADAVELLLEREADPSATVTLSPNFPPFNPRTMAFATSFWRCGSRRELAEGRRLKEAVYAKTDPPGIVAQLSIQDLVNWFDGLARPKTLSAVHASWNLMSWILLYGITPGKLEQWTANDWREAGFNRLPDLKKLFLGILSLFQDGLPPGFELVQKKVNPEEVVVAEGI
ncbi:hypothetical protein DIPPA_52354 [Diplonema papillatum]|nr:hypothetical protein DIPPA_52354 [Diplonema papillatum]